MEGTAAVNDVHPGSKVRQQELELAGSDALGHALAGPLLVIVDIGLVLYS